MFSSSYNVKFVGKVLETLISLMVSPIRVSTQVTSSVLRVQVLFTMGQTALISVVSCCTNISNSVVCKLHFACHFWFLYVHDISSLGQTFLLHFNQYIFLLHRLALHSHASLKLLNLA